MSSIKKFTYPFSIIFTWSFTFKIIVRYQITLTRYMAKSLVGAYHRHRKRHLGMRVRHRGYRERRLGDRSKDAACCLLRLQCKCGLPTSALRRFLPCEITIRPRSLISRYLDGRWRSPAIDLLARFRRRQVHFQRLYNLRRNCELFFLFVFEEIVIY